MIRLASTRDARTIEQIYAPVVAATAISFELVPPPEAEIAARIPSTLAYAPWLVYIRDDEVLGYAYCWRCLDGWTAFPPLARALVGVGPSPLYAWPDRPCDAHS